jgi:ABC-type antimicrobial peptide transport system permease subunit
VKVGDAATLERVRTLLAVAYPDVTGTSGAAPQTFGEVARVRAALYLELRTVVLLVIGVTLVIAGCSLAIAVGGSLVERKRPFTLLRFSGTATSVLRRVVLLESALPLVGATVLAAGIGFGLAVPIENALIPAGTPGSVHFPGQPYYLTVGSGLLLCAAVILLTLPLLNRITVPDNARFE